VEARLALGFALGVKGFGGVFSIRARTASRELSGALDMPRSNLEAKFVTKDHLYAFGRIIQAFVSVETLYGHLILRILQVDDGVGPLLLSGHGYDGLKNLLKTIISALDITDDDKEAALKLVDRIGDKANLRNNVAHNGWKKGKRKGSIKPMVIKTKGTLKLLGVGHNEKDWTAAELHVEAQEILDRAYALGAFFKDRGLDIGNTQETKN
jgi:hypothetical protein